MFGMAPPAEGWVTAPEGLPGWGAVVGGRVIREGGGVVGRLPGACALAVKDSVMRSNSASTTAVER